MTEKRPVIDDFSTMLPDLMAAPYAFYAGLRDAPPVFWAPRERSWVLHRAAEVQVVLGDRSFRVAELSSIVGGICQRSGRSAPGLTGLLSVFLPFINPPEHGLSRRYIKAVLNADRTEGFAPVIERIAQNLLTGGAAGGRFDAATGYADLLPPLFMWHFLGIPGQLVVDFVLQTAEMGRTFDRGCSPRYYARMEEMIVARRAPFRHLVAERRRSPGDDGLSRMIALADALRPMPEEVIADHAMFLIMAGSENTSALIGNAIAATVGAAPGCDLSGADDGDFRAAVEEALRCDSPVQQMWRIASSAQTLGGAQIAAGDQLLLLIGAANRDPATNPDPDRFDPQRGNRRSFGFGLGMHYCLGSEIALLEAQIALRQIVRRQPRRDPDHAFSWRDRQTLRRPLRLPLILSPNESLRP